MRRYAGLRVSDSNGQTDPPPLRPPMGEGRGEGSPSSRPFSGLYRKAVSPSAAAQNNAARLRANESTPERVLWSKLRNRKLGGLKFRRQHPIGPFVADFYCDEVGLVVELDSRFHNDRMQQDAARDAWMRERRITVIRVTASDLARNESGVLRTILREAQELRDRE